MQQILLLVPARPISNRMICINWDAKMKMHTMWYKRYKHLFIMCMSMNMCSLFSPYLSCELNKVKLKCKHFLSTLHSRIVEVESYEPESRVQRVHHSSISSSSFQDIQCNAHQKSRTKLNKYPFQSQHISWHVLLDV